MEQTIEEEKEKTQQLEEYLQVRQKEIKIIVAHHLRLKSEDECVVSAKGKWIHGRFNICVPVTVPSQDKSVLFRCPKAPMLAEKQSPGTVNEKISCEAATYAWMQEDCPDVPVPYLFGFGFNDGRCVSIGRMIIDQLLKCHLSSLTRKTISFFVDVYDTYGALSVDS